ncbi:DUF3131 domain-containing protein [Shimia sp. MMG029]|uniref:DUF3131 domain-containing protein n=1 Tax=Shimia sp. MMG029 TaxID=3021978 RepID=UPI0022FDFFB4|nr:DUF3131 domain-containing protein [Shimia sp. MMG029]MDA5558748.1 DUF3131 domain-containing protein [Shimia sp. MMG029]
MQQTRHLPKKNRQKNRGSVAFILGLLVTAGIAIGADDWGRTMHGSAIAPLPVHIAHQPLPARGLNAQDWRNAAVAWTYFEDHFQPQTGFVNSIEGYPSATLWDQGSYLLALMAAQGLGLIDRERFLARSEAFLSGLERLPLFEGCLPNKAYDTRSLQMVDYTNKPVADGIGWSALDVARMLMALRVFEINEPAYGPRVRVLLEKWDLAAMTEAGRLWGATRRNGVTEYHQEGRIGYEQYGARAAALWGLDVLEASTARPILQWENVSGVDVAVDRRRSASFGAITPVLSEPYLLQAFEIGLNTEGQLLASQLYAAQEARHRATGEITMVSEDHIDQAPHFLYSAVFSNGRPWSVVDEDGEVHDALRTVSLKASFGWDALYDTEYTNQTLQTLQNLASESGWMAGRYELDDRPNTALTLNTNAVVLEALHYKHKGPLLQ